MPLKLTAANTSDVGKQREQNEDSAYKRIESFEDGDRGLFIVADGMGGYRAGEVASKIAVEKISEAMRGFFMPISEQQTIKLAPVSPELEEEAREQDKEAKKQPKTRKLAETAMNQNVEQQLETAIQQANKAILSHGEKNPSARGLGCTVTALLIQNEQATIANVGDSRTYLLRNGELKPVTKDHSLVARLVEAQQIEPEDIYSHPQRNLIYRSLGAGRKSVEVDLFQLALKPGDVLLLCSDGLWEMVHDPEICEKLSEQGNLQTISEDLIDMANTNGGEDNITAVVVHVS